METMTLSLPLWLIAAAKSDLYFLQEVNQFLDETFSKSIEVNNYFLDIMKFMQSVSPHQKFLGID